MPEATVTIAAKADPELGKKRGRIKDVGGAIYQIAPTLAQMVVVGGTYELTFKDEEFTNPQGKAFKYRVVESLMPATRSSPNIPPPQPAATPRNEPRIPPMEDERQTDISVLSLMSSTEWGKKIPVGDLASLDHALRTLRKAWVGHKKSKIDSGPQGEF